HARPGEEEVARRAGRAPVGGRRHLVGRVAGIQRGAGRAQGDDLVARREQIRLGLTVDVGRPPAGVGADGVIGAAARLAGILGPDGDGGGLVARTLDAAIDRLALAVLGLVPRRADD